MEMKTLSQQHQNCLNACFSCAQICEACADDMIGMEQHDHQHHNDLMTRCIRLCRDCADICILAARFISRSSPRAESLCRLCAEICDECAEVCERHAPQHAMCGPCAEECRRCADLCREMVGTAAHSA
ncbi:four-helix bundle copper-binding protein [Nitrospira sp. BLG_2]|uniref:four-helix bundle copper-binding protein n=1 Tax=Nitrospira sp. BLG_2 TaxID=3397507 RepID=UPI003B9C3369